MSSEAEQIEEAFNDELRGMFETYVKNLYADKAAVEKHGSAADKFRRGLVTLRKARTDVLAMLEAK